MASACILSPAKGDELMFEVPVEVFVSCQDVSNHVPLGGFLRKVYLQGKTQFLNRSDNTLNAAKCILTFAKTAPKVENTKVESEHRGKGLDRIKSQHVVLHPLLGRSASDIVRLPLAIVIRFQHPDRPN